MSNNILTAYLHEELDDGVLMYEQVSLCQGKVQFTYCVDYEHIKPISAHDFLDIIKLGMQLGQQGYTDIQVKQNAINE